MSSRLQAQTPAAFDTGDGQVQLAQCVSIANRGSELSQT